MASNSSQITSIKRSGLARICNNSAISSNNCLYSSRIFSCSRPVSLCKRKSRIACACCSVRKYLPSRIPKCASNHSGRAASWPARSSIALTSPNCHPRSTKRSFASAGLGEVLINSIISSILASAIAKPSRIWARSRALRKSYTVRRVTTSRRCSTKHFSISIKLSSLGWP